MCDLDGNARGPYLCPMDHLSYRMRSPDPKDRAEAIAWICETYRRLGSISAVAAEGGVHERTLHRYIGAQPEIRKAIVKAGHVFGAGNVARRVEAGRAKALELLESVRHAPSLVALSEAIGVQPTTIERWMRVYPGVRKVVERKLA